MDKRIKLDKRAAPTCVEIKLNQDRVESILQDIYEGSTRFHAAEANGIAYETFYKWVKQGQFDLKHCKDSLEARLVQALREIEQEEIKDCRSGIKVCEKGHTGKQWTLEKVYWQHFGGNAPLIEVRERLNNLEEDKPKSDDELL